MLVPTREIGIERWHQFREAYANRENRQRRGFLKVCYSDGEHHGDDWSIKEGRFDVAIMVNEKFRYFAQSSRFLAQVGEVLFDELNVMTDADRGVYLEMAMTAALRAGDHTSVLGLTTPAQGIDAATKAMQASGRSTFHLETTRRPIAIEAGIWSPQTKQLSTVNCNTLQRRVEEVKLGYPGDILKTLKELLIRHVKQTPEEAEKGLRNNLVIAVPTKKDNIQFAHYLYRLYRDDSEVREIIDANKNTELIATRLQGLEPTKRREMLLALLPLGIGFHDADLTAEERKLVGQCFRASEIPLLVCTSTMAQGINLPAQTIAFVGWGNRPSSGREGPERDCYYKTLAPEFVTWLGRVGRYGKRLHRQAQAVYLSQHGPGSEEYETIERLLLTQRSETMLDTCRALYLWLVEHGKEPKGWDVLDVLTLLRRTVKESDIRMFRTRGHQFEEVRRLFAEHLDRAHSRLGAEWADRSPLVASKLTGAHTMATLLAMLDWRVGKPIYGKSEAGFTGQDIETTYGLFPYGCSVYDKSREFARLLRVFAAVANGMPEGTFPASRPLDLPRLESGVVCLPHDLDELADEMLFGIPRESASLAKIGIEGLTRAWVMQLKRAVDERGFAPDLPLLERIRFLSEDMETFRAALPTPGLADRILTELKERTKVALAENLRKDWKLAETFYSHPFIAAQHVEQGCGRFTAFKMRNQRVYTVMRRNAASDQPIMIHNAEDLQSWIKLGAVEVLAEIGRPADKGESGDYLVDCLYADLDPKNDFPLERLKRVTLEVYRRFTAHEWVDQGNVRIHWTGGKGFHVIAFFKGGVFRPVEQVKRVVEGILSLLCNDVAIFVKDQTTLPDPFVILDLSPLMLRGLYRNAYSLNAATGNVCIPVDPALVMEFDPQQDATIETVLASLTPSDPP